MFRNYLICISLLFLGSCGISSSSTESTYTPMSTASGSELVSKNSYTIGSVDTAFQLIGPDHKIEVGGVPDPKIAGITCFYSRAKTGGISGALGLAEDTSDASVSCRQTGKIVFLEAIKQTEEIWSKDTSIFFKSIQIVRFYDKNSNSLIYLVYSDKLIDGSPKNSISAIALESIQPTLK